MKILSRRRRVEFRFTPEYFEGKFGVSFEQGDHDKSFQDAFIDDAFGGAIPLRVTVTARYVDSEDNFNSNVEFVDVEIEAAEFAELHDLRNPGNWSYYRVEIHKNVLVVGLEEIV